jgi:phage N-6-adenine-methyltransferase
MDKALFTSGNTEWETPPDLFKRYDDMYHFDLDVCATTENAKCKRFFSPSDDGLQQQWIGNCWMNPPYGRKVDAWIKKAFESAQQGATIVALLPARTDCRWFHEYIWPGKARIEFIRGRIKFVMAGKNNSAPFPSMIVIWGHKSLRGTGKI